MAAEADLSAAPLPYPPLELADRVGSLASAAKPFDYYDLLGRETRDGIVDALPSDWSFRGKRVLDFGCGAGRTLRHFATQASEAELWGCDIDERSIHWMQEHMCPPFRVFVNGSEPPIDQPDSSFDLIWAISVFTHLASNWSRWLAELHRLLKPDALLLATFMGRGMVEEIAHEPWDESKFGMNVIRSGQSWDLGGPMVIHSPWWIEEHWGRAFEIISLAEDGFASKPWLDHGFVLMRKRDEAPGPETFEAVTPADARETRALAHNTEQLLNESKELREGLDYFESKLRESEDATQRLTAELLDARGEETMLREQATTLHQQAFRAEREAATMRARSVGSAHKLLAAEEVLAQSKARIFALEERVDELQESIDELQPQLERAQGVTAAIQRSLSWRITAPLRALKPRKRRG